MIQIIKSIFIILLASLSLTSCLDKYPIDAIPADDAINTVDDINQAVLGIYAGFKSPSLYSGTMTLAPDIQSDLVHGVIGYTNQYGKFWRWEILPTDSDIENVYASLYVIIGRCNFLLENEDKVRLNTTDDIKLDALDVCVGEAYFAKALAYSELIKLYCKAYNPQTADTDLGVVLISKYTDPEEMIRASLKDSYAFVLSDLDRAEELIDVEATPNGANADFFTIEAVNSLRARIYLYMQNWSEAVKYSTKVIDESNLILANATTLIGTNRTMYTNMWTNDISNEVIWRTNFTTNSYGGALGSVFLHYNYLTFTPDYVPSEWILDLYSSNDYRYNAFFSTQKTGYSHKLTWPLLVKYFGNETFLSQRILHVNMPKVFRLSEQYLIRAEANCNLENYSSASKDITKLRSNRILKYGVATLSKDNWLEEISEERVRELYMEGFRLQDLKRWNMGFEREEQIHTVKPGNTLKVEKDNPLFVWPIPQHELNAPGSKIEPNESNK